MAQLGPFLPQNLVLGNPQKSAIVFPGPFQHVASLWQKMKLNPLGGQGLKWSKRSAEH